MHLRRKFSLAIGLALVVPVFENAKADGVAAYFESSGTEQKPRSNAGLSINGGDWLKLQAGVALRGTALATDPAHRATGSTEVVPSLRSAVSIAPNFDLETRLSFAEWNAGTDATADTRLRYRKSLRTFINSFEGSVWRSRDGLTRQALKLGFRRLLGDAAALTPLKITGTAVFEATQSAADWASDSRRVGFETRLAGLMPRLHAADQSLSFKVEKTVGTRVESASTLAYNHAWTVSSLTSVGFKVEFPRRSYSPADDFEPALGFDWNSRF
jgi:hypothetical protein